MSNAKVMTFSEISKFLQDFLKNFFSKKEGVFAPNHFLEAAPRPRHLEEGQKNGSKRLNTKNINNKRTINNNIF